MAKKFNKVAMRYADDVLSGKQIAGPYIKLAIERHLRDLENGKDRGLRFDHEAGQLVIDFIEQLRHWKGTKAGERMMLEPNQQFYLYTLFGWKREDGTRRFRTSYKEIARKNGKTTECAGKGMFTAFLDREPGAQVYFVATKEDQARIGFKDVIQIIKKTPGLPDIFKSYVKSVVCEENESFLRPLGSDSDTQDGFDPHHAIIDEYHAHPNDGMLNVMESGMVARRQPLTDIITTAGFNKTYPCFGFRKTVVDILEGRLTDDALYGLIFSLDEKDDWQDPDNWIKANPNLGASVRLDNLLDRFTKAKNQGGEKEVEFKTKSLNLWVDAAKTWIKDAIWTQNLRLYKEEDLRGLKCYAALDLSATKDFTAFALLFPMGDGTFKILLRLWIPEDTVEERVDKGLADLRNWIQAGHVRVTKGNTVDYDQMLYDILDDCKKFQVESIANDPWATAFLPQQLAKVLPERFVDGETYSRIHEFRQGYGSMSSPTKEFERLALQTKMNHDGNPALRWMLGNVAIDTDAAGNNKPDKEKASNKIDGVVAVIMALGEYLTWNWQQTESVYEERGLRSFNS